MPHPRRALSLIVTAAVLLGLGALVAQGVSGALGISFKPVTAPAGLALAVPSGRRRARLATPEGQVDQ